MEASAAKEETRWESDLSQVRMEDLPEGFREIAKHIGLPAALALVAGWGGRKLTVPARAGAPLQLRLGGDACARLCAEYSGRRIHVPTLSEACRGQRDRAIRAAHGAGATVLELMRRFGLSERSIQGVIAGAR